jgi:molybdopterin-synthase adenylyltransferase
MSKPQTTDLTDAELEFYSRQIMLPTIGYQGQLKLRNSKVCIVGLGGLGSPIALQLAAMGVGFLRLVDRDVVDVSNLQRQHLYGINFVGYPKVEVAARRLRELNPHVQIEPLPLSLNASNAEEIFQGMDLVIDGLDLMAPRYTINRACVKLGIPYVFGAAITTIGSVSTILPGKTACLECFQGNINDDDLPKCALVGVHPSVLSIVASIQVSEATKILVDKEPLLVNKLFHCDLSVMTFEEVDISKVVNCPVCGLNRDNSPVSKKPMVIAEACGRDGKRVFVITPEKDLGLDIDILHKVLIANGADITVKAELGITCTSDKAKASFLKSGIMIIQGESTEEGAYDFYNRVIDRLK